MNVITNLMRKSNNFINLKNHARYLSVTYRLTHSVSNQNSEKRHSLENGPDLKHFIKDSSFNHEQIEEEFVPYISNTILSTVKRKVHFLVYGCQMNINDTEIVWSILKNNNFERTEDVKDADVVLMMTCAIREGAENKIWNMIGNLKGMKKKVKRSVKIGILGCMAERLKHQLIEKEKAVDLVAGPDSYKDLPRLLALTENNQTAVNVLLSLDETYADVMPVRLNESSKSGFVSIMRGCDNMCTYCIVPFTRGRERSRPIDSILNEIRHLSEQGVKEVTLLGQNVNSYRDTSQKDQEEVTKMTKGFKTVYKIKKGGLRFAELLDRVSLVDSEMRIRFTSPHPKDFPDEVLHIINERPNICKSLHLPAQSGNSAVLERMRRGYTREAYLELIDHVRTIIPGVSISSDFISGFCGETDEEFNDTLSLIDIVKYNTAYLYPYSMREKTTAHRRYKDDVSDEVKRERHLRMTQIYRERVEEVNKAQIGEVQMILIEGRSKRSEEMLAGRNEGNIKVIIPSVNIPISPIENETAKISPGDYVAVKINEANSQVLKGTPLFHTTINKFNCDTYNIDLEMKSVA